MRDLVLRAVVAALGILALESEASTSGEDPFNALGPLEQIVNFFTGGFGRFLVILALIAVAVKWWNSRDDMSERFMGLVAWGVAAALILGAPNIVDTLGFASATF